MSCDATYLGAFDSCDDVVFEFVEAIVEVENLVTERFCDYVDGNFGKQSIGTYRFEYEETIYEYQVV